MTASLTAGRAMDGPTAAALRMFARHQRYSDTGSTSRCGFCRGPWHTAGTDGRLVDGCAARQLAAAALVGLLTGAERAPAYRLARGVTGAGA